MVSIWVLYAPPRLREGTWEAQRRAGEHLIDTLTGYAPNFRQALLDWQLFTPVDLESALGSPMATFATLILCPSRCLPADRCLAGPSTARQCRGSISVARDAPRRRGDRCARA